MEKEYEKQGMTYNQYKQVHRWLLRNKKKSGQCEHCKNIAATQNALIKGLRYERKLENYLELCVRCHNIYDVDSRIETPSDTFGITKSANGKWRARIVENGRKIHLGTFSTKVKAVIAYNAKAKEMFGALTKINRLKSA